MTMLRWAIEWNQNSPLDGKRKHFIADGCNYRLFRTKKDAKEFIREHYGYIAKRGDLRVAPHNWRTPQAVKVNVILKRTKGTDNG